MKIGPIRIARAATLAPMEEHTNHPFRCIAKRFGAALVVSERIDAADVAARDRRALRLLHTSSTEAPRAAQLSGADPNVMAAAAEIVAGLGFDLVDLNFDCSIRRLAARGEGGVLLSDPPAIERIVAAVRKRVAIPVMLKIRSGPDAEHPTAVEVAKRAEGAGAAAVCVHGRSVAQGYVGEADWSVIRAVKQAVGIPVLGSGSIRTAADALALLRDTGADAAAIARGCLGNPWIFQQTQSLLSSGPMSSAPSLHQRGRVLLELVEGEFQLYGQPLALRRLPRTAGYFAHWLANPAPFRESLRGLDSLAQFRRAVREYFG